MIDSKTKFNKNAVLTRIRAQGDLELLCETVHLSQAIVCEIAHGNSMIRPRNYSSRQENWVMLCELLDWTGFAQPCRRHSDLTVLTRQSTNCNITFLGKITVGENNERNKI